MTQTAFNSQYKQPAIPIAESGLRGVRSPQKREKNCPLSVCHVVGGGYWAGVEAQVATLLRALTKNPEVELHAIVFNDNRLAQELRRAGVDLYVAGERHKSFPRLILECSHFVRSRKVQILHSHSYKENLISLALSYTCKVPHLVRTEHGHPEVYPVIRNLKHWCVLALDRLAARYTPDRIISVSSDLAEYWKNHSNPEKVIALRNAVDLERVHSNFTPAEAKQRLGIPGDSFVVGIAARLEAVKRLDLFVSTAADLAKKIPNCKFVIAGGGGQEQWLRQLILNAGLQSQVSLLGERNDVYDVLRAMDILLMCSDHEGVPMVMLEAMALGAVVVSRRVGGIPELVAHGSTGILIPSDSPEALGDACMKLFEKPDYRNSLAQAARQEICQKYSAEKNAESVLQVYRSICVKSAS